MSAEEDQALTNVDQPGAGRLTGSIACDCLVGACSNNANGWSAVEGQPEAGGLTDSIDIDCLGNGCSNTEEDRALTFADQSGTGRLTGSTAGDGSTDRGCLGGGYSSTEGDQAHTFVGQPGAGRLAGSIASD